MQNLLMFHVEHLATQDCHEVLMFHVEHISSPSETYHDHADRSFTFNPWVISTRRPLIWSTCQVNTRVAVTITPYFAFPRRGSVNRFQCSTWNISG